MTRLLALLLMIVPLIACPTAPPPQFGNADDDDDRGDDDDDFVDDLVFGEPCLQLDPDEDQLYNWFEGEATSHELGWAVVGLDDINGDGLGEIAFSARRWDGATFAGRVYVFFSDTLGGGEALSLNAADVILESPDVSSYFGTSLTALDDIDRDDKPELMVGATGDSGAYLFTSTQLLDDDEYDSDEAHATIITDISLQGGNNPEIGMSVLSLGNLDSHPSAEVAIGASNWPDNLSGLTSIFSGAELEIGGEFDMLDAEVRIYGSLAQAASGLSLGALGDITGDGRADLMIGSFKLDEPDFANSQDGVAWIFSGGPLFATGGDWLTSDADTTIVGVDAGGGKFGITGTSMGDYDQDGVGDFVIGEPQLAGVSPYDGYARVFSGASFTGSLYDSVDADISLSGSGSEGFGAALSASGDLNGDGEADLLIAGPDKNLAGLQRAGVVYIARSSDLRDFDGEGNSADLNHQLCGSTVGERIGQSTGNYVKASRALAIVPDVDGDGLDDILIGAPTWTADNGDLSTGRVYLVLSRFVPLEPDSGDDDDSAPE